MPEAQRDAKEGNPPPFTPRPQITVDGVRIPVPPMLDQIRADPFVVLLSGFWGLFVVGLFVWQNWRNNRQQSVVDAYTNKHIENLNTALSAASINTKEERERADRLLKEVTELSMEIGGIRSDMKYANVELAELRKENERLNATVESLVAENRNKDRSISRLTNLNKQILRVIGTNPDTMSGTPQLPAPGDDSTD